MPLHVIGLGVAEQAELVGDALAALQGSEVVIGSSRQLDCLAEQLSSNKQALIELPKLSELEHLLREQLANKASVALLASGDPLFYGIGAWVARTFKDLDSRALVFHPAVSSVQAACHRLHWSLQDVIVVSVHGRPLTNLAPKLAAGQRYILLTDKHSTPQAVAQLCAQHGFSQGSLVVCERLGYQAEQLRHFDLAELLNDSAQALSFADLNVIALELNEFAVDRSQEGAHKTQRPEGLFPGIADSAFITDKGEGQGMITKREVRLAILSLLAPAQNDVIWDVGAGCGGVSVELALWGQGAQVHALEHHPERLESLQGNRERFAVQATLTINAQRAPAAFSSLPQANKVFVGGSDGSLPEILKQVWAQLPLEGVLVASAVTETTRQSLLAFYGGLAQDCAAFESLELSVRKAQALAGELYYKPNLPVTLFKFVKIREVRDV